MATKGQTKSSGKGSSSNDSKQTPSSKRHFRRQPKSSVGFKGGIEELRNQYFDCTSYLQADQFITTSKAICEHVGRTYQDPGDIRATLDNMTRIIIPMPQDPADKYSDIMDLQGNVTLTAREQVTYMEDILARQEVALYVKRKATLDTNIQKAYSLILGQCTDAMKNKLCGSTEWDRINRSQDALLLLEEIRSIIFRFEDQKYPVLSLHNAKCAFYNYIA